MMVARRRHLAATAHEMASIPDPFAYHTRMRLSGNGRKCGGKGRDEDERYEFAHRSILERSRIHVGGRGSAQRGKEKRVTGRSL